MPELRPDSRRPGLLVAWSSGGAFVFCPSAVLAGRDHPGPAGAGLRLVLVDDGKGFAGVRYEVGDLLGGVAGEVVQDGLVGVAGDAGGGVAEVSETTLMSGGGDVAQVAEADRWQVGGFHEALEEVDNLVRLKNTNRRLAEGSPQPIE
jgi:hypothetical protein